MVPEVAIVEFTRRHPTDSTVTARYGLSGERGTYVDVDYGCGTLSYDAADPDYEGIKGAMFFLATFGGPRRRRRVRRLRVAPAPVAMLPPSAPTSSACASSPWPTSPRERRMNQDPKTPAADTAISEEPEANIPELRPLGQELGPRGDLRQGAHVLVGG